MRRRFDSLGVRLLTCMALVAGCGAGGGKASQATTGPTVVTQCARPAPKVGQVLVDEATNQAGIVRHVEKRGTVYRATLSKLSDFATSADGNSSNGSPTFTIDIDCGPRDSNNTTTPPPPA